MRRPDGGDNPDVAAELRAAAAEVGAMVRAGRYWSATSEGGMSVGSAPGPVDARCANFRAVQQDGRPTGESACVTVQGGSFIEVRATTWEPPEPAAASLAAASLLSEVRQLRAGRAGSRAATPVERPGNAGRAGALARAVTPSRHFQSAKVEAFVSIAADPTRRRRPRLQAGAPGAGGPATAAFRCDAAATLAPPSPPRMIVSLTSREPSPMSGTNQRIDGARLWDSLMAMAAIGATPGGGVRRLTLSDEDRRGRDLFGRWCAELGLAVRVDEVGNTFARRPGRDPSRPPVLMGSHLDSQPSGGKFDGALGVLAGLEVLRTLADLGIETEAPIELVNWTDEEGSRFGRSLLGSGVWAGVYGRDLAYALRDAEGTAMGEALERIGYRGPHPAAPFAADSYFELHIEQGPILEAEGRMIGIVTGAQAQVWWDATITGQDAHAGTTPPAARRDALVGAARIIALVDRLMRERGNDGRGTVGELHVVPNSRNVIPGAVRFSVEFRHPDTAAVAELAERFPALAAEALAGQGLRLDLAEVFRHAHQPFDAACVDIVRAAAARLGHPAREIVSGAGHDAVYVARHVPAAMIFTPCAGGLSHNENESILPAEAEAGCQVLLEAVLARAGRATG